MPPKAGTKAPVPAAAKSNRYLPSKEAGLFKQVLQQYETKEWKKGLKTAETILKSYPEHGETLAMRGLLLANAHPDRKAEGYDLIKEGCRKDVGSHIVWHVLGLLYRSDKNFEEALKCYTQANRIERDSLNILGDMATLTIHLRHYDAYVDARQAILRMQPRLRKNWIGLAVAQHLAGQYAEADRTLRNYEDMLREVPAGEYEHSEVLLYHALVLEEAGELERCIDFLAEHATSIVDRNAYSVQRAHLLLKLGRMEPAEWAWGTLLEENPDSYEYIKAYVLAKGADVDSKTDEGKAAAAAVLTALTEKFPRSLAIRRINLELVSGDEFRAKASKYLIDALAKGVPSVFADVKSLYSDKAKRDIIGELAEGYRKSLEATATFGVSLDDETASDETIESSAAYLWTLYFLAQHYSALSSHAAALTLIDQAIGHTPSLPELPMLKARILKRAGDVHGALAAMTEARALDGQDRFLNSKNAKYLLRADKVEEAEKVLGLFTKKDAPTPLSDLIDMQALWVLEEEGKSFARQSKFNLALKRYHQMFNVFQEVEEDQYDFHTYCLRKMTLRAYINLLRYSDQVRSHPRYFNAAKGAIEIYLALHDDPSTVVPAPLTNGAAEAAAAEKKKEEEAKAKAEEEKEKSKKKVVDEGKKPANKKAAEEDEVPPPAVDQDPSGDKLLATKEPLDEALKFLKPLEKVAAGNVGTWLISFEVAIRREKYLQALTALKTAHSLSPSSPLLHPLIVRFAVFVPTLTSFPSAVTETLQAGVKELIGDLSVDAFNSSVLQKGNSSEYVLAAAKGASSIHPESKEESEGLVFQLVREGSDASLKIVTEALGLLRSIQSSRVDEFVKASAAKFPLAAAFKSSEELAAAAQKAEEEEEVGKEVVED
ncbi:hypothetical protein MNV49_004771 [Pseudohyphozyma bogoriensis]|nr:hypothetical protein MNV49_004771 [Pseudohyphozyma bogoriensis]